MKKTIILVIALVFLTSGFGFSGQRDKQEKRGYSKKEQKYNRYPKHHPKHQPRGRAYGHYNHHERDRYRGYKYNGHYMWHDWNRERQHHRDRYRDGRYHHDDNGYLMFSYCNQDKGEKVCFSISID